MARLRQRLHVWWRWVLRQAHDYPWASGLVVVFVLLGLSLPMGAWMGAWEESWVKWLNNSFAILGGLSLTFGWAIALVAHAQRKDVELSFVHAGHVDPDPEFPAALILASESEALMEWQLRHLRHRRVEMVWTAKTRDSTQAVLNRFAHIECLHGPGRSEVVLTNPFDLNAVKDNCRSLLLETLARFSAEQVCVGLTGSTAVMSIAAFQVAEELSVTSLYLMGAGGNPRIRAERVHDRAEGQVVILSDHRPGPFTGDRAGTEGS